jgi:bifunctional UDP-N-acetylglucosamine pyrophosphorylase/glucosamine-1-phosphate N-acetyltransferase
MEFKASDCHPLTLGRAIGDFPIGNIALSAHQQRLVGSAALGIHSHAWLAVDEVALLASGECGGLLDASGEKIAWRLDGAGDAIAARESFLIRYPWDFLRANEAWVGSLGESIIDGEVHPMAIIEGLIHVGEGTRILPGVFIEGNVVIGRNCKIGPNCYIRGNTSIGDGCHIGQSVEIKNTIVVDRSSIGHLSYVGDSVLGEGVNFGAGTTTSNLRHDGSNHRSTVAGELVDTGRRKFGAIIGDGVHTGINTSIYPGRKMWPGTTTLPGAIVQHDVHPVA